MIHIRRLLKGIIYVGVAFLFFLNSYEIQDNLYYFLAHNKYDLSWMGVLYSAYALGIGYFFVGWYFLLSYHLEKNPAFERTWSDYLGDFLRPTGPTPGSMKASGNISKMQQYRDSVLATQSNSDGASEYMKTAWVDGIANNSGEHTDTVKQYIDSKLSSMSNQEGYNWLKGESSK